MTLMQSLQNAIWSQLPTRFFETVKANLSKNVSVRELSVDSNFDIFEWSLDYEKYVKPIRVDSVERLKDTSHSSYCEVLNKYLVNSVEKLIKCTVPTDRVMAALSAIEEGLKLGSSISEPEIEPTTGLMWI